MDSQQEMVDTVEKYERTQFRRSPWNSHGQIHGLHTERFARHTNGVLEKPTTLNHLKLFYFLRFLEQLSSQKNWRCPSH